MYRTRNINGEYSCAEITISKEQWLSLLAQESVFTGRALSAIALLYNQPGHKGCCFDIELKYHLRSHSYNGIIGSLAKRVCRETGVYIADTDGSPTYWVVLMSSGKHVHNENGKHFEWQLRPELVEAMADYLCENAKQAEVDEDAFRLESTVEIPEGRTEGKRFLIYSTRYERNSANREAAIGYHGTKCMVCGFDFEETYGEIGRGYIEVHHIAPISDIDEETVVNPFEDLVCLCANCHRMIHRKRNAILSVNELRKLLKK